MDSMERHVQEMLDLGHHPVQAAAAGATPISDRSVMKAYIVCEINRLMEEKLKDIVDAAIVARLNRIEASRRTYRTDIETLQATRNMGRHTLGDLDALHRPEHTLDSAMVERLFQAQGLEDDPDAKLKGTTLDLQGTDSVNTVLVSRVEALVMKVQRLEKQAEDLQHAHEKEEAQSQSGSRVEVECARRQ